MIKWFAQKYLISLVNDLLEEYKEDIDRAKDILKVWIARIDKILYTLRSLLKKLEDNQITDEEVEEVTKEITTCIKEW